jgi:hypothetical protein
MRILLILLIVCANAFGQSHYSELIRKETSLNNTAYDPHVFTPITNYFHHGVSYNFPSSTYFDGNLVTKFSPNQGIYYPCSTFAAMDGVFEFSHVNVYGPSSNATLKICHGDDIFTMTLDTTINLNYTGVLKVNLHNVQGKFLAFVLNQNQGPQEIQVFAKAISLDPIPPRVTRGYKTFRQLTGFNTNFSIPHSLYPWDSTIVREYDSMNKLMNRNSDTLFAFSPDYIQYIPLDDHYQQNKDDGLITIPLFHQTPDSLFKPSYINAGKDFNYNSRAIQYGTNPYTPASWISKARLAYQVAARWGSKSIPNANLKVDLVWGAPYGNVKKSGTRLTRWFEPDNERISWFNTYSNPPDLNKFDMPGMVAAEGSALWDGHENTMGPLVGIKNADPDFKLIQGALADRDIDAIKYMYYWYQKYRTDKKFCYDVINFHEYQTNMGGFDSYDSRSIHPEVFTRRGETGSGTKNALNHFTEFIHRYLPGTEIMYSEWGFDACRNSPVGVQLPSIAERVMQVHPLNSWQKQGGMTIRMMAEIMSVPYIDYSIIYEIFNEIGYTRIDGELPDDVRDGAGNNVASYYSIYAGAIRYKTSGLTLSEFGYKPATTSSPVNLSTLTNGTTLTFTLKNKLPKVFPNPIHIRADADDGATQNAETIDGTIVSQNDSVVVINVTSHTGTASRSEWRFDAKFLKKPGWYMYDNTMAIIGDCKFIADSSTSEYRRYIFSDGYGRVAEMLWLPTNIGNEITRTIKTSMPSAYFKNLESFTGATTPVTITSGEYTTSIYEIPKIFYYDSGTPNVAPVANAGADKSITTDATTFAGTGTDADGTIASYVWSKTSGSGGTLSNINTNTLSVSGLFNGSYVFRLTVTDNQGATNFDEVTLTVSGVTSNAAPTANAGSDKTITASSTGFTGSGSDADGTIASYAWTKISGPSATLTGATTATLSLSGLTSGSYIFRLTVTDNLGATGFDDVSLIVSGNAAPVAAFLGVVNTTSSTVDLYDNGSSDADGTIVSYVWTRVSGPNTPTLTNASTNHVTITGLVNGSYVIRLTVTDNLGATDTEDCPINVTGVSSGNVAPVALAGADKAVTGATTSLSGSGTDSDGTIAAYLWTQVSGPNTATITSGTTATPSLSGLAGGTYVFRLRVTDNLGAFGTDDINVSVTITPNLAPVAAFLGVVNTTNTVVDLYDNGSTDSDGTIASFAWTRISGPNTPTLTGASTNHVTITGLVNGSYVYRLTVTDNLGATDTEDCPINVTGVGGSNAAPLANAGADKSLTSSSTTVSGSGTDSDGTIASYAWTRISGPNTPSLSGASTATLSITGMITGTYVYRLTVTDDDAATATDDVTIVTTVGGSNTPPVAAFLGSISTTNSTINIYDNGSTDADGTIVSYAWTRISGPNTPTMSGSSTNHVTISGLINGSYIFRLTVTDNGGATDTEDCPVTVSGVGGSTPSAWVETSFTDPSGSSFICLVRLPTNFTLSQTWPVIVFVHGDGEKATGNNSFDFAKAKTAALPKALNEGLEVPAVVVCPISGYASFDITTGGVYRPGVATNAAAEFAITNYAGDPQRCHLTGISGGGATIFPSAINFPNRWATCMPMMTSHLDGSLLSPVRAVFWYISSENDNQSNKYSVVSTMNALNGYGNIPFTCKYTIYASIGHSGWNETYKNTGSTSYSLLIHGDFPANQYLTNPWKDWMLQYKIVSGTVQLVTP